MNNILVKLIGYPATLIHGDPAVFDRWMWLRQNLKSGNLRTLDDEKLVKNISNLLKPGGKLLLTAPYKHYYKHLVGDDKGSLSIYEDGGHVRWGYTHEEMENIFNKAGLVMKKKEYVSGIISQLLIALYRRLVINVNHKVAWLVILPLRLLVVFDPFITKLFNLSHLSIAVVGIKKL